MRRPGPAACLLLLAGGGALLTGSLPAARAEAVTAVAPPESVVPAAASPAAGALGSASAPADLPATDAPDHAPHESPLQHAVTYWLDTRAGAGTGESSLQVDGLEAEIIGSYGRKWEFAAQVPLGSEFSSRGRGMHYGNLYAVRKWRLGAPTLKFGQFVVPYGNLTTYNVHNRIIQSLSRYSLGVRIDPGVEAEGYLLGDGSAEWQLAVTAGDGPYRWDRHGMPLVTGRVSHKFEQQGNTLQVGLTAAAGTLPVFSVLAEPVSAVGSPVLGWANKRRVALDAEVEHGMDLFRLEGDLGADGRRAARGLWLGWTRPLGPNDAVETAAENWHQPEGDGQLWGAWVGGEHRLDGLRTLRAALRWSSAREESRSHSDLSLTVQLVRQF